MQPVGGGAPRPGCGPGLPGSLRQLDPVALLMLLVDAGRPEPVRSGARELALFLTPEPGAEAKEVEETIEGMLLRLEEFCSLTDMIRSDTSQILEESIPLLQAKVTEMRGIYAKVDQLENPPAPLPFELPALYRTEDYFPAAAGQAALRTPGPRRRRV
ncbi:breast carcinoma-amplified sequence 4 isoform X8 [Zalophus californianus]|uniref:Breast carcinoma-amplified sequence 4 isoform X8 n=1 Tax=Zalophus californianus TaxID=9704 RepID=A0A6J2FJ03_ZALCA|nr:breast carcinoma-amplified sequence 4 isoform X8 [Zalophus californianus]XP_027981049.1 breast carcinoma-amplified sequence 4 isoform X3 [Eumetopias jubatus]